MAWIADPQVLGRALKKLEGHGTLFEGVQPLGLLFSVNAISVAHWYSRAFAAHPPMPRRLARIAQVATRH
jgi:Zn-dependent protease with chaperone function